CVNRDWLYRHHPDLPFRVRHGRLLRFSELGIEDYIRKRRGWEIASSAVDKDPIKTLIYYVEGRTSGALGRRCSLITLTLGYVEAICRWRGRACASSSEKEKTRIHKRDGPNFQARPGLLDRLLPPRQGISGKLGIREREQGGEAAQTTARRNESRPSDRAERGKTYVRRPR